MHVSAQDLSTGSRRELELDGRRGEAEAAALVTEARAAELEDIFSTR